VGKGLKAQLARGKGWAKKWGGEEGSDQLTKGRGDTGKGRGWLCGLAYRHKDEAAFKTPSYLNVGLKKKAPEIDVDTGGWLKRGGG